MGRVKVLNGAELAGFIKERQVQQIAQLRNDAGRAWQTPKLVIFYDNNSPVIAKYIELKRRYGQDIGVAVEVVGLTRENATGRMKQASEDEQTRGIIVQLPLENVDAAIIDQIPLEKDVDGLRGQRDTATATAIHWLLTGYGVDLAKLKLGIVGRGKLVGAPLEKMWRESGYDVTVFRSKDNLAELKECDVVVSATGVAGLIKSEMLGENAIVVDAGTASEGGVLRGDLAEDVRTTRTDLTLTPRIGGVGPLTVAMLFEAVIRNAQEPTEKAKTPT